MFKKFLENNEENMISLVTILIIIIGIIVVIINWAMTFIDISSTTSSMGDYEFADYESVMTKNYQSILTSLLNTKNTDELYKKTDLDYLAENDLTEENFKSYLLSNNLIGNSITFSSSSCISSGEIYVFKFYYKNYSDYKYVNVIETSPYEYYISFDQNLDSVGDVDLTYAATINDITAELTVTEQGENFVRFNLRITNNNVLAAKIDFNDINSFILFGDEIDNVRISSVVTEENLELTSGSSMNRELYFSISLEDYEKCDGLRIRNIEIDNEYFDLEIYF